MNYLLAVIPLLLGPPTCNGQKSREPKIRLLVPAYFYPAGKGLLYWNQLIAAASKVPITAIVNPASGPGKAADGNYLDVVDRSVRAGIKLIGYVPTNYTKRPIADVKADIETWLKLYPKITGFLLDEQPSGAEGLSYFTEVRSFVRERRPGSLLVGNPGTSCSEEYIARNLLDVVCLFENKVGIDSYQPPQWTKHYPAERFMILPYQIGPSKWRALLDKALSIRSGYFFVTDDGADGNPWDSLPAYWTNLVESVRATNGGANR